MGIESIEVRLARLEGGDEQISQRLGRIEVRLDALCDDLLTRIDAGDDTLQRKIESVEAGLLVSSILIRIWLRAISP